MVLPCNKSPWYAYHSNLPRSFTMVLFHEGTDNLLDIIHENTSLILDSIVKKADEASLGENDK